MPENASSQNRYQLGEVLGRGGMGVVYRAYDTQMKREVALKTLLDVDNAAALELFNKEWGLLASVVHPNIIEIYDAGEFEQDGVKRPFFVMPLLRGATLEQLIRESSSRLGLENSIAILAQAARGLHAAHELGLIHRDMKPSNVFVMDDDSVKLIDFGIARLARTASGTVLKGTIHYMAPELFQMKPPAPASDQFSLAVVCYEALSGGKPFRGVTDNEVIAAVLYQDAPPLSDLNPDVNYAVSKVVHRGLAKQPEQRFRSVREFGEMLQRALQVSEPPVGETVAPTEPVKSLFEKAQQMAEAHPDGAEAVVEQGLLFYPDEPRLEELREVKPPPAPRPPPPEPRRRELRRWLPAAAMVTLFVAAAVILVMMRAKRSRTPSPAETRIVSVSALPLGATILLNGEVCGVTHCEPRLPPGTHKVEARLAGYQTTGAELTVGTAATAPLVLTLVPLGTVVRVVSDQENASVLVDDQPAGRIQNGEFELWNLAAGAHTLALQGPAGRTTVSFETAEALPPWLREPLERVGLRAIVVGGMGASARVWANLRDQKATLDGQPAGTLAEEGLPLDNLAEGTHELALGPSKISFGSESAPTLTAFIGSDTSLGSLRILTGEDGVAVFLNGQRQKRSTQRGRLLLSLAPKKYAVRVMKEGFVPPSEQTVEVKPGEEAQLEFKLAPAPKFAAFRLRGGTPGAEVLLDGNPVGAIGADGTFVFPKLDPPGKHTVLVRKDTHKPRQFEMEFKAGATVELEAGLETALGSLRIEASPPLPQIRLALRREGETAERPMGVTAAQLPEGTYRLSGTASGYQAGSTTVRVTAGRTTTAALALRKLETPKPVVKQPLLTVADWERAGGWTREAELLTRRGGNVVVAPLAPMAGSYQFTVLLQRGSRLEWLVNYEDDRNYVQYQLDRNNFSRTEVVDGRRSDAVKTPHGVDRDSYISVQIDVSTEAVRHRILRGERWEFLDEFRTPGGNMLQGPFAFRVGGRDQIGLRDFRFVPR